MFHLVLVHVEHMSGIAAGNIFRQDGVSEAAPASVSQPAAAPKRHQSDESVYATWTMYVAPSTDEKSCPIALENCHEDEHHGWHKYSVEHGAGGLKDRPKRGTDALNRLSTFTIRTGGNMVRTNTWED